MAGETQSIHVNGVALVKVGPVTATSDSIWDLGYTRNGAEISFQGFFLDVPGDENGGDDGPPIDVQYMGETATIRMELTKYNATVAEQVQARLSDGAGGVPGQAGFLMFGDAKAWRLLIVPANSPINFPRAFPRNVIELNKGTRFSTLVVEFEAHKAGTGAAAVLWNADTT